MNISEERIWFLAVQVLKQRTRFVVLLVQTVVFQFHKLVLGLQKR